MERKMNESGNRRERDAGDLAGSPISTCPIRYVITLRITTFFTERLEGAMDGRDRWNSQIAIAFATANRIYNRYGIRVRRGHEEHVSVEESRRILASSRSEVINLEGVRGIGDREIREREENRILERGDLDRGSAPGAALTEEVCEVLSMNRGPARQACSYWVPTFGGLDGNCFHRGAYDIDERLEGVVLRFGAPSDTLAHELGHLMTRAGHDDFDPSTGEGEGNLPRSNLMWLDSGTREEPRELSDEQARRMRASFYTVLGR
jgi:hypothetical protein